MLGYLCIFLIWAFGSLAPDFSSAPQDPPRKCPAVGPASGGGQQCGSLATCSGMGLPVISFDSCSTKDDGECEPSSFKRRWSCTFAISNVSGAGPDLYVCAAGPGVTAQDCKGGAHLVDPLDPSTHSVSDSEELACNSPGRFRFVFFNKDPSGDLIFACCAQYNLECSACD
jgi:hypothetical protein